MCGTKNGSESFVPAEGSSLTFRVGLVPWRTVFNKLSLLQQFCWVYLFFKTISHQARDCLALQPMKTNGFHRSSVKGKQVYPDPSASLNHQTCFRQVRTRAFTALSCATVKWSRKPLSVLFHRGAGSRISTWGSTGCSLPFPLERDKNVSWFSGFENGSISSCWALFV